ELSSRAEAERTRAAVEGPWFSMRDHCYFVYILTNCSRHPLYTGVTRTLGGRHVQHNNPDQALVTRKEDCADRADEPKVGRLDRIWRGLPISANDHLEKAKPRSLDSARRGGLRSG